MTLHAPCTLPARMPPSIPPYTPPCSMQGEACCPVGGWGRGAIGPGKSTIKSATGGLS